MKILKRFIVFSIAFLMLISVFPSVTKASVSNVYKQGVYNISEFEESVATAKLVTQNTRVSLMILDNEGDIKFFKEFDTVGEVINLGTIKKGHTLAIVGNGDVAIITTSK
ncbi:hypothetical protein [Clostridium uliginosum]|uniref:Uncharacterized protein n=1 Tax=Clostridium uliginosum TaxID=119641 RepID=A0A1I1J2K5_9CLOT|nr:hypothetical protein [Clostridium uliginosum]SFC39690.1 hypothetical protein SAMN05421842_10376 [Clostridium uliginosum]